MCHPLDLTREDSIVSWTSQFNEIDWLINAVGLLHDHQHGPEKSIKRLDAEFYLRNMQIEEAIYQAAATGRTITLNA